jgi:hypothetical protein
MTGHADRAAAILAKRAAALRNAKIAYAAWWIAMPPIVVAASFGALCAYECTSYPWLILYIAPLSIVLLALLAAVLYWRWTASLPDDDRRSARRYLVSSALWGPAAAAAAVVALVLAAIFLL